MLLLRAQNYRALILTYTWAVNLAASLPSGLQDLTSIELVDVFGGDVSSLVQEEASHALTNVPAADFSVIADETGDGAEEDEEIEIQKYDNTGSRREGDLSLQTVSKRDSEDDTDSTCEAAEEDDLDTNGDQDDDDNADNSSLGACIFAADLQSRAPARCASPTFSQVFRGTGKYATRVYRVVRRFNYFTANDELYFRKGLVMKNWVPWKLSDNSKEDIQKVTLKYWEGNAIRLIGAGAPKPLVFFYNDETSNRGRLMDDAGPIWPSRFEYSPGVELHANSRWTLKDQLKLMDADRKARPLAALRANFTSMSPKLDGQFPVDEDSVRERLKEYYQTNPFGAARLDQSERDTYELMQTLNPNLKGRDDYWTLWLTGSVPPPRSQRGTLMSRVSVQQDGSEISAVVTETFAVLDSNRYIEVGGKTVPNPNSQSRMVPSHLLLLDQVKQQIDRSMTLIRRLKGLDIGRVWTWTLQHQVSNDDSIRGILLALKTMIDHDQTGILDIESRITIRRYSMDPIERQLFADLVVLDNIRPINALRTIPTVFSENTVVDELVVQADTGHLAVIATHFGQKQSGFPALPSISPSTD